MELLIGLPVSAAAIAIGVAVLVMRRRIAALISRGARKPEDTGVLITMVAFFLGSSLAFIGTGLLMFVLIRALGGVSASG